MLRFRYLSLDDLLTQPPASGAALLLRHAERFPFVKPGDVLLAGLTEQGILASRRFGKQLTTRFQLEYVVSSPVPRCVHTAELILEGSQIERPVGQKWWLFSPYLRARDGRSPEMAQPARVVLRHEKEDDPFNRNLLEMVLERVKIPLKSGALNLYVCHDTTILPLLAYLLGLEQAPGHQIPDFLQGILLIQRDGKTTLDDAARYLTSNTT